MQSTSMSITIPVQDAIFAFTSGLTFQEYLAQLDHEQYRFITHRYSSLRIDPASQGYLATYGSWLFLVLLVSNEAPDTFMVLPIVQRLVESSPRLDLRIVSDEADLLALNDLLEEDIDLEEDLADLDLPLLFFFDEEWNQRGQWGPHPAAAEERLEQWLAHHPEYETLLNDEEIEESDELDRLITELTNQMRLWYNDDLTQACVDELIAILRKLD